MHEQSSQECGPHHQSFANRRRMLPQFCYRRAMKQLSAPGAGIAIGVAIGVAMGAALGNVGIGIALGVAFGAAFEGAARHKGRERDERE